MAAWWDRFAKADEGTPDEGRVDLYDLEVEEISFVDAGDNEGARVLLYKRHRGNPGSPDEVLDTFTRGQYADPELVQQIMDEVAVGNPAGAASKRRSMDPQTFTKAADVTADVQTQAQERVAATDGLTIAQARVEVWYENPALAERYQQLRIEETQAMTDAVKHQGGGMMLAPTDEVAKAQATVLQKHQTAVREIRKADPRMSLAQARRLAWEQNPELAEEYRRAG